VPCWHAPHQHAAVCVPLPPPPLLLRAGHPAHHLAGAAVWQCVQGGEPAAAGYRCEGSLTRCGVAVRQQCRQQGGGGQQSWQKHQRVERLCVHCCSCAHWVHASRMVCATRSPLDLDVVPLHLHDLLCGCAPPSCACGGLGCCLVAVQFCAVSETCDRSTQPPTSVRAAPGPAHSLRSHVCRLTRASTPSEAHNGKDQANCSQEHWGQGAPQAAGHQGACRGAMTSYGARLSACRPRDRWLCVLLEQMASTQACFVASSHAGRPGSVHPLGHGTARRLCGGLKHSIAAAGRWRERARTRTPRHWVAHERPSPRALVCLAWCRRLPGSPPPPLVV
jgi:hypothetical protein